jgi:thiamine biosynthesis lipoprotein
VSERFVQSMSAMSTVVTVQVVGASTTPTERDARAAGVARALEWFAHVEAACSRFDAASELRGLSTNFGVPVAVSPMLFHALSFSLAVARDTDGAFDPTIGRQMEALGFNRSHRDDAVVTSPFDNTPVSFRDIELDDVQHTVCINRPLALDLGAVAKGLAIDLASRELDAFPHFAIDAGGDQFFRGHNAHDEPWSVGIRHPRERDRTITTLRVTNRAVCTSGDYERVLPSPGADGTSVHHLRDARTGASAYALASVTVLAPTAMVADALATAAFALGPNDGSALLARHGVDALLITPELECLTVGSLPYA